MVLPSRLYDFAVLILLTSSHLRGAGLIFSHLKVQRFPLVANVALRPVRFARSQQLAGGPAAFDRLLPLPGVDRLRAIPDADPNQRHQPVRLQIAMPKQQSILELVGQAPCESQSNVQN